MERPAQSCTCGVAHCPAVSLIHGAACHVPPCPTMSHTHGVACRVLLPVECPTLSYTFGVAYQVPPCPIPLERPTVPFLVVCVTVPRLRTPSPAGQPASRGKGPGSAAPCPVCVIPLSPGLTSFMGLVAVTTRTCVPVKVSLLQNCANVSTASFCSPRCWCPDLSLQSTLGGEGSNYFWKQPVRKVCSPSS